MTTTILSSRDFNRDPSRVKRAASHGPVFVTERNKPALVVLSMKDYQSLSGHTASLADQLTPDQPLDFAFDPPKAAIAARVPDFD